MKTLTKITLLSTLLAVIIHIYLAFHYYPIKFGFSSGPSVCSINATFDCDAVAASQFSSFLDVPLAIWGAATNAVIFVLVLLQWWGWTDHPERLRRWNLVLIAGTFVASVVMGALSLKLHSYCLFCISAYVLSIVAFICYRATLQEPFFGALFDDVPALFGESRGILFGIAAIPILAFIGHRVMMESYGVTEIDRVVQSSILDWKGAPKVDLAVAPALAEGPSREQAKMVISEFADFRCHHCKNAYPSLDRFAKNHADVRLEFYNFPLDGECNEMVPDKTGISCRLAYSVVCAEKQGQGWNLHHALYDDQDTINGGLGGGGSVTEQINTELKKLSEPLKINTDELFKCMADPATIDAVRLQAKQGVAGKIQGTPTIFVDGRVLNRGQLIPVLDAAMSSK